jgi:poly [ADP-ribose] polymerase 2/3/4
MTDVSDNHNKFWHAYVEGSSVHTDWGRIGEPAKHTVTNYDSPYAAERGFASKCRAKERHGYTLQKTLTDDSTVVVASVKDVALSQIAPTDPETKSLVEFLAKRNIHRIEGTTGIRVQDGALTTPLGPVTPEGLDEAEHLLAAIGSIILAGSSDSSYDFRTKVNQYLRIVPRKIHRRGISIADVFPDVSSVAKEQQTIDALRQAVALSPTSDIGVVFRTRLDPIDSSTPEFTRMVKLFDSTRSQFHKSSQMKLKRLWKISVGPADESFEHTLKPIKELWHGTKDANLLSILRSGFVIPGRGGTAQITGRMFGDGVYFSDQSTKSLNYASGFWGGDGSVRNFMLLNHVAMGKIYKPTSSFSGKPPSGYDSTQVEPGTCRVKNREMVVYRASQAKPVRLCEFA